MLRYSVPSPAIRAACARGRATTRRGTPTTQPLRPATRPAAGPAIRRCGCHDTAPSTRCARGLGAVGAQPGPLGVHLCTQPSFGLSALFQSLFGTLFMNTVHDHCSQNFLKKNK